MRGRIRKFKPGDYKIVSDRSGRVIDASNARKEWNGLVVAADEFEERNVQEYVRGVPDPQAVPVSRPRSDTLDFLTPGQITRDDIT